MNGQAAIKDQPKWFITLPNAPSINLQISEIIKITNFF